MLSMYFPQVLSRRFCGNHDTQFSAISFLFSIVYMHIGMIQFLIFLAWNFHDVNFVTLHIKNSNFREELFFRFIKNVIV